VNARRVLALTPGAALVPRLASACPVCFGAADGPLLEGSNMGILALLLITLAVLGAFGAFFFTLARRASRIADVLSTAAIPDGAPSDGGAR
jgi:hypothetical protein